MTPREALLALLNQVDYMSRRGISIGAALGQVVSPDLLTACHLALAETPEIRDLTLEVRARSSNPKPNCAAVLFSPEGAAREAACGEPYTWDDGVPYCDTCGLFRGSVAMKRAYRND